MYWLPGTWDLSSPSLMETSIFCACELDKTMQQHLYMQKQAMDELPGSSKKKKKGKERKNIQTVLPISKNRVK